MSLAELQSELKGALKQFPNFPSEGILFEDFLPIFTKPELFQKLLDAYKMHIAELCKDVKIDYVIGLESRGFLFGPTLALQIGAGFIPVRKPGKLPGPTFQVEFQKEYGSDKFEMQQDVIPKGANVLIVDDILATGGFCVWCWRVGHQGWRQHCRVLVRDGARLLEGPRPVGCARVHVALGPGQEVGELISDYLLYLVTHANWP